MSSPKRPVKGFNPSNLPKLAQDELPYIEPVEDSPRDISTPRRTTTIKNIKAFTRDVWAPKSLRGWLALRTDSWLFGLYRTWTPFWCVFDSRYLLLYLTKPGSNEVPTISEGTIKTIDPSKTREFVANSPTREVPPATVPIPVQIIDVAKSKVEATYEEGNVFAFIRREGYPEFVFCGQQVKYWIHEWQKIGTIWEDDSGSLLDLPTDVVDKTGTLMKPTMDAAERLFLRQQGAFLLYMSGPLQFEAWHSRLGGKWFLHYCVFDAYSTPPTLLIYPDLAIQDQNANPKVVDLTGAEVTEHLDERKRCHMKIQLPSQSNPIICEGPNIQWWLGSIQWALRDRTADKSMFRALVQHRVFSAIERSVTNLRLMRRASETNLNSKNTIDQSRKTIEAGDTAKSSWRKADATEKTERLKRSTSENKKKTDGIQQDDTKKIPATAEAQTAPAQATSTDVPTKSKGANPNKHSKDDSTSTPNRSEVKKKRRHSAAPRLSTSGPIAPVNP